jgi:hypothetical protein
VGGGRIPLAGRRKMYTSSTQIGKNEIGQKLAPGAGLSSCDEKELALQGKLHQLVRRTTSRTHQAASGLPSD